MLLAFANTISWADFVCQSPPAHMWHAPGDDARLQVVAGDVTDPDSLGAALKDAGG